MVLKRQKKNQIKSFIVKHCKNLELFEELNKEEGLFQQAGGISTSMFLNLKDGIILCFSFRTISKNIVTSTESVYLAVEELNMVKDDYCWTKKIEKVYEFQMGGIESGVNFTLALLELKAYKAPTAEKQSVYSSGSANQQGIFNSSSGSGNGMSSGAFNMNMVFQGAGGNANKS